MFAFAFKDDHAIRLSLGFVLNNKIGTYAIPSVSLDRKLVVSDQVAVPPKHVFVAVQSSTRQLARTRCELRPPHNRKVTAGFDRRHCVLGVLLH